MYRSGEPCVCRLQGDEARHATRVMRLGAGDAVTLFDGTGWEYTAVVRSVARSEIELVVTAAESIDREAPVRVTLGVAMPKGDRQKVLVEKLTELGVACLTPLVTERSVAQPKASGVEKLRRTVIEASKQCGRNRLMQIDEPTPLQAFLERCDADRRLIAHPHRDRQAPATSVEGPVAVAIGPEGGFTEDEVAAAEAAGWGAVSLGRAILRVETAAIAAAARFGCP